MNISHRKSFLIGISAVAVLLLGTVLFTIPAVSVLEWRLADNWATAISGKTTSDNVAVIGIDEKIFETQEWPLEKDVYGDLIDFLNDMGAKVIAFDIIFSNNLYSCGRGDEIFLGMIEALPNVVLASGAVPKEQSLTAVSGKPGFIPSRFAVGKSHPDALTVEASILPYDALLNVAHNIGFINMVPPFLDGIDRRMPLVICDKNNLYPSFSLRSAALFTNQESEDVVFSKGSVAFGQKQLPTDEIGCMYVNFERTIPFYPLSQIRKAHADYLKGESYFPGKNELSGRAVFIGNTAVSLGDYGINPLSRFTDEGRTPLVFMHARSTETIISNTAILNLGRKWSVLLLAAMLLCGVILFLLLPFPVAFGISIAIMGGAIAGSYQLYAHEIFVPVIEGLTGLALFSCLGALVSYFEKDSDRRFLFNTFKTYLSPQVIEKLAKEKAKPSLGGESVVGTAFFSDIEGFTSLSEELDPDALIRYLNIYFQEMTHILLRNEGTLDKFIGDAIVAFFGAPHHSETHALEACSAAFQMQTALAKLRENWKSDTSIPPKVQNLKMRIGINSGEFVTGNIGCDIRMNYTMIGDPVNLAARLESAAKQYGVYTVIGPDTAAAVESRFHLRKLDMVQVKGKIEPVYIYELMGVPGENDKNAVELILAYSDAFEEYIQGNFSKALELFEHSLKLESNPEGLNPSQNLIDRCKRYVNEPPEQWNGVYTLTMK